MGRGISRTLHSFDQRSCVAQAQARVIKTGRKMQARLPSALFDALSPELAMRTLAVDIFSRAGDDQP